MIFISSSLKWFKVKKVILELQKSERGFRKDLWDSATSNQCVLAFIMAMRYKDVGLRHCRVDTLRVTRRLAFPGGHKATTATVSQYVGRMVNQDAGLNKAWLKLDTHLAKLQTGFKTSSNAFFSTVAPIKWFNVISSQKKRLKLFWGDRERGDLKWRGWFKVPLSYENPDPMSPDLNPVEHIWQIVLGLHRLRTPTSTLRVHHPHFYKIPCRCRPVATLLPWRFAFARRCKCCIKGQSSGTKLSPSLQPAVSGTTFVLAPVQWKWLWKVRVTTFSERIAVHQRCW